MDGLPSRAEMRMMARVRPALRKGRVRAIEEEDERYNPINTSNNPVMRGGSSRTPRRAMADSRAMEIQMRNQTPGTGATPVMGVSQFRGGSATPSMGLSQFRGGSYEQLIDKSNVARSGAYEGQGHYRKKSMPPPEMRGGKHHRDGNALSQHLAKTLGKAAHRKLMEGMMRHAVELHGGAWYDIFKPENIKRSFEDFGQKVKNEFENPRSKLRGEILPAVGREFESAGRAVADVGKKVGNEFVNPGSVLRTKVIPKTAGVLTALAPVIDVASTAAGFPGVGTMLSRGAQLAQGANAGLQSVGLGRCGGKKRRAPASASDGRRKRADIVRKVMKERGVSMIEASKIVKSEGLY